MIRLPRGFVSAVLASETSSHALYRARSRASGRAVMIKAAKRDSGSLRHEAAALAALRGPGVVGLVSVGPGALVMELVRGPTLEARIRRALLDARELDALADALGAILDRIHRAGWVFGDLKPENVILRRGRVADPVLIDFETAVTVGAPYATRATTAYASPERLVGAPLADPRSDLFALGAILHAAAEGASPFAAESRDASVLRVLALEPGQSTAFGPELGERVAALLAKEPAQRPESWEAVRKRAPSPPRPVAAPSGSGAVARVAPRALRLEGERAEEALLAFTADALARGELLLHLERSARPYGAIAAHALRILRVPSGASFRAVFEATRRALARLGPRAAKESALVLADVLAGESDAATRGALDALRADPELLGSRRREAFLALLRSQPRTRSVITVESSPDGASAQVLRSYLDGTTTARVLFVDAALDVPAEVAETGTLALPEGALTRELAIAALWGEIFDARELAELSGGSIDVADGAIVRAIAAGLLVPDPFGRGFRFRSARLRERAAEALAETERGAIAGALASLVARRFPRDEARVARAFAEAGEPLRAAYYAWRGAARALDASDHRAAAPLVALGDEMLVRVTGSVRSLLGAMLDLVRAGVQRYAGDHRAAGAAARRALAFLPTGARPWCEALGERATAAGRVGDPAEVLAVASALRSVPAPDATFAWDRACSRTAVQLFYLGKEREARALVGLFRKRTVDRNGRPDHRRRALSPGCLVTESLYGDRIDEHLGLLANAVRVFETLGDWRSACLYGSAIGFAYGLVGEYARAEKVLRETLAKAERTSAAAALRVIALHNLGEIVAHRPGRLDEGIAIESEAIATLRAQGDNRLLVGSLLYRARMWLAKGDLEAAERDVRDAMTHSSAFPSIEPWVFATLSLVMLERGRSEDALAHAQRAQLDRSTHEVSPALVALATARALEATGRTREARAALRRGVRDLETRAARIADARLRRSYLTRVPDHAELARRARW